MSSVFSWPSHLSCLQDEDGSSWWEGVCEAADLNLDKRVLNCDIGVKRMLLNEQNRRACSVETVPPCWQAKDCTPPLASTVPTSSAAYSRLVLNEKRSAPSDLKIAAAKFHLNSGKQHVNYYGKARKARKLKDPCHENCNRCVEPRLNIAERREVFDTFWSLSDHERQWLFIYGLVKTTAPRSKSSARGGKQTTRSYHFHIAGTQRRVCKTMFKNTLCICDSWIDSALSHFSKDGYKPDMRGKIRSTRKREKVTKKL